MYITKIIPITKNVAKEELSYFTKTKVTNGSLVSIPLRKKIVEGIVVGQTLASTSKTSLRNAPFVMRKLSSVSAGPIFLPSFMEAVENISNHYATFKGGVISSLIPKTILKESKKLISPKLNKNPKKESIKIDIKILQADWEERIVSYKSVIREEFARGHSVFLCLPTKEDIKSVEKRLEKGIEKYTKIFHVLYKF